MPPKLDPNQVVESKFSASLILLLLQASSPLHAEKIWIIIKMEVNEYSIIINDNDRILFC